MERAMFGTLRKENLSKCCISGIKTDIFCIYWHRISHNLYFWQKNGQVWYYLGVILHERCLVLSFFCAKLVCCGQELSNLVFWHENVHYCFRLLYFLCMKMIRSCISGMAWPCLRLFWEENLWTVVFLALKLTYFVVFDTELVTCCIFLACKGTSFAFIGQENSQICIFLHERCTISYFLAWN